MKKKSKKEEKKSRRIQGDKLLIGTIAIIILFIGAVFAVKYFTKPPEIKTIDDLLIDVISGEISDENHFMYNGFPFVYYNGAWYSLVKRMDTGNVYNIQFRYNPKQVENVSIDGYPNKFLELKGYSAYVTFDPLESNMQYIALAATDLTFSMAQLLDITPIAACTRNETNACSERPIISCENNKKNPIMLITQKGDEPKVIVEGNCLTVQGKGLDLIKAVDKLLMTWYGIFKPNEFGESIDHLYVYANKIDETKSINVKIGLYDRDDNCAWTNGNVVLQFKDSEGNIIKTAEDAITYEDRFKEEVGVWDIMSGSEKMIDFCTMKYPIRVNFTEEEFNEIQRVNAIFKTATKTVTEDTRVRS